MATVILPRGGFGFTIPTPGSPEWQKHVMQQKAEGNLVALDDLVPGATEKAVTQTANFRTFGLPRVGAGTSTSTGASTAAGSIFSRIPWWGWLIGGGGVLAIVATVAVATRRR